MGTVSRNMRLPSQKRLERRRHGRNGIAGPDRRARKQPQRDLITIAQKYRDPMRNAAISFLL